MEVMEEVAEPPLTSTVCPSSRSKPTTQIQCSQAEKRSHGRVRGSPPGLCASSLPSIPRADMSKTTELPSSRQSTLPHVITERRPPASDGRGVEGETPHPPGNITMATISVYTTASGRHCVISWPCCIHRRHCNVWSLGTQRFVPGNGSQHCFIFTMKLT